jgi:hypothetical protein
MENKYNYVSSICLNVDYCHKIINVNGDTMRAEADKDYSSAIKYRLLFYPGVI